MLMIITCFPRVKTKIKLKTFFFRSQDNKKLVFKNLKPRKGDFMCIGKEIDHAETLNLHYLAIKNSKETEILGT